MLHNTNITAPIGIALFWWAKEITKFWFDVQIQNEKFLGAKERNRLKCN